MKAVPTITDHGEPHVRGFRLAGGGAVPYVLRPRVEAGGERTYKFMGECYVHGAMYGKFMTEGRLQDSWIVRIV